MKRIYQKPEKTVSKARKDEIPPSYVTYALANKEKIDPKTNVAEPSLNNVEQAREWVNVNQK